MKNVIIYPYNLLFTPFLRQLIYENKYNTIFAVMPGKWYQDKIDASFLDEGNPIGIPILKNFEEQINFCDTVLWVEYNYEDNFEYFNKVISQMLFAIKKNKNLICMQKLEKNILHKFEEFSKAQNVEFNYLYNSINESGISARRTQKKISVPIITIMGIGENCSKFETQLIIRKLLSNEGYKISQVGSRQCCEILGFHSFPQFMFDKSCNEIERINSFYNFIIELQKKENPDIIIIGIPGGIIPYNDKYNMGYGIMAFEICNAINFDFNILNLWCDNYDNNFFTQMENVLKYKFNTLLDCICMSNISINSDSKLKDVNNLGYNVFSKIKLNEYKKNNIMNSGRFIYDIIDDQSYKQIGTQIINQLS